MLYRTKIPKTKLTAIYHHGVNCSTQLHGQCYSRILYSLPGMVHVVNGLICHPGCKYLSDFMLQLDKDFLRRHLLQYITTVTARLMWLTKQTCWSRIPCSLPFHVISCTVFVPIPAHAPITAHQRHFQFKICGTINRPLKSSHPVASRLHAEPGIEYRRPPIDAMFITHLQADKLLLSAV